MADSGENPQLSKSLLAMRALYGHDDSTAADVAEIVADFVADARGRLGEQASGAFNEGRADAHKDLSDLHIFMIGLEIALREDGDSEFKIEFKRRKAGKPIKKMQRARAGHRAAVIVEKAVAEGTPTESAIADAVAQTGVSRSEIFTWLASSKKYRDRATKESG